MYLVFTFFQDSFYMMIPMVGPAALTGIIRVVWQCSIFCSGSFHLTSKLLSMEEYLELCEISNEQFDQLFEEVHSMIHDSTMVNF